MTITDPGNVRAFELIDKIEHLDRDYLDERGRLIAELSALLGQGVAKAAEVAPLAQQSLEGERLDTPATINAEIARSQDAGDDLPQVREGDVWLDVYGMSAAPGRTDAVILHCLGPCGEAAGLQFRSFDSVPWRTAAEKRAAEGAEATAA